MRTVSVSELKARLSRYLREVRRGGEVQILDRGVPVARLIPIPSALADTEHRDRLIGAGVLRPGSGDASGILDRPPLDVGVSVMDALVEDRRDRL
ncbi:MAG TPA: type II toxin-antitoxin system prevent-host-death family antitoxin [Acidimicrobiia bacterium]